MRRDDAGAGLSESQASAADSGLKGKIPLARPFLDYVISGLADAGITDVCLGPGGFVGMNSWSLPPEIYHACRSIGPSMRGELELPDAVMYARDELGVPFRVLAFHDGVLGNQVPETIALCRLALQHGAGAASAFGAGFGGSVWALVAAEYADRFMDAWRESYGVAFPVAAASAEFFVTRPGPGAMRL